MNQQKIIQFLFVVVPVLLLLSVLWHAFVPFLSIAVLFLVILFFRTSPLVDKALGRHRELEVYYLLPDLYRKPQSK